MFFRHLLLLFGTLLGQQVHPLIDRLLVSNRDKTKLKLVRLAVVAGSLDVSAEPALAGRVGDTLVLDVNGVQVGIVSALATDTQEISSPGSTSMISGGSIFGYSVNETGPEL